MAVSVESTSQLLLKGKSSDPCCFFFFFFFLFFCAPQIWGKRHGGGKSCGSWLLISGGKGMPFEATKQSFWDGVSKKFPMFCNHAGGGLGWVGRLVLGTGAVWAKCEEHTAEATIRESQSNADLKLLVVRMLKCLPMMAFLFKSQTVKLSLPGSMRVSSQEFSFHRDSGCFGTRSSRLASATAGDAGTRSAPSSQAAGLRSCFGACPALPCCMWVRLTLLGPLKFLKLSGFSVSENVSHCSTF